ncbi:hypothetical protein [Natrialba aegyptia]|uniref:Uncharacterized protein n=1 Tax=Natrialba aegyptia DSM 13077 TaxID=1227491 RepID=M0B7Y3_9EURY|nr:hypothetical protein [Natrialba aegyptia]ELZ05759.1 hypothetical protein C480_10190 [Natrialba aegyptia DSM 13077]
MAKSEQSTDVTDRFADWAEHQHEVGDVLTKVDTSEWKVTNRMVDIDTGETLYRLHEMDVPSNFRENEILTESQISRSFDIEAERQTTDTTQSGGAFDG